MASLASEETTTTAAAPAAIVFAPPTAVAGFPAAADATPAAADGDEPKKALGAIEGSGEEDATAVFEAVVKLEEVETKSGEEEEECIFKIRAKLFVFGETLLDKGTGTKTWRERGIGEAKLLKHREFGKIRLLMRQEKTMKVIVNHVVDPRITLEPNAGSDRSWVWSAFDFSAGELIESVFAMRFSDSENAGKFKDEFQKAQEVMKAELAGEDTGDAEAGEEAAEALAGLSTKTSEEEEN